MLHRVLPLAAVLTLILLLLPLSALPSRQPVAAQAPVSAAKDGQTPIPAARPLQEEPPEPAEQPEEPPIPDEPPSEEEGAGAVTHTLRVKMPDGSVEEMELEEYLWGVVAAEMPAAFEEEALKAQAVAARTYTLYQTGHTKENHPEADICTDYNCCQAWISRAERMESWAADMGETYAEKITVALRDTAGEIVVWDGTPALTVFHAASAGATRSAADVWGREIPYLVSVESPEGEEDAPNYYSVVTLEAGEFARTFQARYPQADFSGEHETWFREDEAEGTYTVGGVSVTGEELRGVFALRSATFRLEWTEDSVTFYVTGYGHGVGMSQYGANVMAQAGATYREILAHYYPGTETADVG